MTLIGKTVKPWKQSIGRNEFPGSEEFNFTIKRAYDGIINEAAGKVPVAWNYFNSQDRLDRLARRTRVALTTTTERLSVETLPVSRKFRVNPKGMAESSGMKKRHGERTAS